MSYKPTEATLAAYLYGELAENERQQVERYLEANPAAAEALQKLGETRKLLGHLPDKEVIAPPIFMDSSAPAVPLWRTRYFRMTAGIAAALLLLLIAGRLTGIRIDYGQSALRIGFGNFEPEQRQPQTEAISPPLTEADVREIIDAALTRNNEELAASWSANDARLKQSIEAVMKSSSQQMDNLVARVSAASQDQISRYAARLQQENARLMKDYFQLTAAEQKEYVEDLLVDFSRYLQEQRTQDLMFFQTRMSNIEQNTNQLKQETEQILGNIIASGAIKNERNNY